VAVLQELGGLVRGLASGEYPRFVTRAELGTELPVFLYHRIDSEQLAGHLRRLRDEGYRTLTAGEHHEILTGKCAPTGREVVLTSDDGLSDLYERMFPLLHEHGMRVVAFLIAARVGEPGMVSWDQVREMHASGVVDVQSHSMHHAAIPISGRVVDFYHHGYHAYEPWDVHVGPAWETGVPSWPPALGTPLLEQASCLGDARRFRPDPERVRACTEHVAARGGAAFFERRGWRRELRRLVDALPGRLEGEAEQRAAIERELLDSKSRIERELPGHTVRHLAHPWNEVGRLTQDLLPGCGYLSAYAGLTRERGRRAQGRGLFELARLSGDFVLCLPGRGRRPLWRVMGFKVARRLTRGQPY